LSGLDTIAKQYSPAQRLLERGKTKILILELNVPNADGRKEKFETKVYPKGWLIWEIIQGK
jgi:hypothetical protein